MGNKENNANKPVGKPVGRPGIGSAAAAAFNARTPLNSAPANRARSGKLNATAAAFRPPQNAQKPARNARGNGFATQTQPMAGKPLSSGGAQNRNASRPAAQQPRPPALHPAPPPNKSTWKCKHCGGESFHLLIKCNSFLAADVQTRHDLMAVGGHCYICFKHCHRADDCEQDMVSCDICHKRHHALLHRYKKENATS